MNRIGLGCKDAIGIGERGEVSDGRRLMSEKLRIKN